MIENHPVAVHLRKLVYDAMRILIDQNVPNAIPGIGFNLTLKLSKQNRVDLKCSKVSTLLGTQWDENHKTIEIWSAPAWHLLKVADPADAYQATKADPPPQP